MSRQALAFYADDVSAFARALKRELAQPEQGANAPSHLTLLNMVARAGGYRNFQHFRAQAAARERVDHPQPAPVQEPADYVAVARVARNFDAAGQLTRRPGKFGHRMMCLWVFWSRIDAKRVYSEAEINRELEQHHLFGDHALLRREMCDRGLMTRTPDGRECRRVEQAPPVNALALIRHLTARGVE